MKKFIFLFIAFAMLQSCDFEVPQQSQLGPNAQIKPGGLLAPKVEELVVSFDDKWAITDINAVNAKASPDDATTKCTGLVKISDKLTLRITFDCYGKSMQGKYLKLTVHEPSKKTSGYNARPFKPTPDRTKQNSPDSRGRRASFTDQSTPKND